MAMLRRPVQGIEQQVGQDGRYRRSLGQAPAAIAKAFQPKGDHRAQAGLIADPPAQLRLDLAMRRLVKKALYVRVQRPDAAGPMRGPQRRDRRLDAAPGPIAEAARRHPIVDLARQVRGRGGLGDAVADVGDGQNPDPAAGLGDLHPPRAAGAIVAGRQLGGKLAQAPIQPPGEDLQTDQVRPRTAVARANPLPPRPQRRRGETGLRRRRRSRRAAKKHGGRLPPSGSADMG
jgi:hypothetical protein